MKKLFRNIMFIALAAMTFHACEDVPAPYDLPGTGSNTIKGQDNDGSLPYTSGNLYSGWKLISVTADQPWSQGNTYTQATGYQKWDGADNKSNRAVEGWLVSPSFKTTGSENVKISFDQTIRYTNSVSGWEDYHKVYASNNYTDGNDIESADWVELAFTPVASPYSDWTLYTSGEIQLPVSMANQENIHIAFWFKAPANASTTWELENFKIEEGIAENGNTPDDNGTLPYTSNNLNAGWNLQNVTTEQPWSQGGTYTQATGYQKWDGASEKSNRAVEGWLISPTFNTTGSQNVKISFMNTIMYTNNVTGWEAYHKIYASKNYDGNNFNTATWVELNFTPVASPYSDWTLYSSGEIQLPTEMANVENVHIAFWFKAPANASTTWELEDFKIEEGIATNGNTPTPTETIGTATSPITVSEALALIDNYTDGQESATDAFVKGKIVAVSYYDSSHKSLTYYISDNGTATNQLQVFSGKGLDGADFASKNDLAVGADVVVKGKLKRYVKSGTVTPEINQGSTIVSISGGNSQEPETPGVATGTGTLSDPYNAVAATNVATALGSGNTSTEKYYIKGKISSITYPFDTTHGTATFYISDDGSQSNQFQVYSAYYLENKSWANGNTQITVGDDVIIYGQLTNYNGTPETASKKAYVYSLNGKTKAEGGGDTPTPTPVVGETGTNGDFESWTGNTPDNWKTASSAGNATLSQSTDAHGGNYSVQVGGASTNKRLGYKEMNLKAGDYTLKFYVKAATADGGSVRPGYVAVENGVANSSGYTYGDYVNNLTNSDWVLVEHNFSIPSDGTYSIVIMNSKTPGKAVLIDDLTLTMGNTTVIKARRK